MNCPRFHEFARIESKKSDNASWIIDAPVIVTPQGKFLLVEKRTYSYKYPIEVKKITILDK